MDNIWIMCFKDRSCVYTVYRSNHGYIKRTYANFLFLYVIQISHGIMQSCFPWRKLIYKAELLGENLTKRKKRDRYKAKSVVVAYCSRIGKYVVTIEDLYIFRRTNSVALEAKKSKYWVMFLSGYPHGKIAILYMYYVLDMKQGGKFMKVKELIKIPANIIS